VAAAAVGLVIVAFVAVLATRETAVERRASNPLLGRDAPLFSGESVLDGSRFSLADQRGKWVVLNVFASWCVPCVKEHPDLVEFHVRQVRPDSDVALVSAVFQEPLGDVRAFFAREGGTWPVLRDNKLLVDYGVTGVPETMLISPAGQILWRQNRQVSLEMLEEAVARGRELYASAAGASTTVIPSTVAP
jgi:cytochrome c biogenesis protein CcmG/thiol:disulfide interchange protein DsbE